MAELGLGADRQGNLPASVPAGRAALALFALAPERIYLNHGGYGATPLAVIAEQDRLRREMERDPTGFFQDVYPGAVREAAGVAAREFGGDAQGWVFAENATSAIGGILDSLPFAPDEEMVTTSHAYGAVAKAMARRAARSGARVVTIDLPAPLPAEDEIVARIASALGPRTRLLVVDHIASPSAAILPVAAIVAAAGAKGVPVLVDGAHAPGQIPLDVPALGAAWWTGNAHKWFFAPRGCGLLWTAPEWREATHPAVASHGSGAGLAAEFDWIGTRDVTPWLALRAAAAAHRAFGGPALMARNRALARSAAALVSEALKADISVPETMSGAMAALRLPGLPADPGLALELRRALARRHRISLPVYAFAGAVWVRLSAQLYNERGDYEALAAALGELLTGLRGAHCTPPAA